MELYHVGFAIIEKPDLNAGRRNADFGKGFYLSGNKDFSVRWARKRHGNKTYLNTYELDTKGLKVKSFRKDKNWFRYIYLNRHDVKDCYDDYDVIIGPIANDTIFDTLGLITSGVFSDDEALELMKAGKRYMMVVIKSEKALERLSFIKAEELLEEDIDRYREMVKKEEERYQKKLADLISGF